MIKRFSGLTPTRSRAVAHDGLVFTVAVAPDPVTPSLYEQTVKALGRIDESLALCGTDKSRILSATLVSAHKGRGSSPPLLRHLAKASLLFAGLLALSASGPARADDPLKARVGVLRLSSSAPVFIAQDKGYFRDAGLDIELKFFDAAQPIAVATTSGDIDVGITAFTAGLYNLAGKGTLKVIGGMSREKAGYPLIGYFASNNAYAAGLKTPKDLAGKRVAVTQVGSSFHYSLGLLADKYGFKLADVKVLPLQSLSNAAAALQGETVDAALLPASTARKLMDNGGAKLLGWVGDETPWQLGAVFASPKTLANKPLVTKLLAALARADREYHDVILAAVKDGKAPINAATKPLLEIIAKYTNLPVEQVVGNCAYIDPDGKLDVANVGNQIEWLQAQGFVDKGFGASDIIAEEYVKPD